jgi:hypothetical protein
MGKRRRRRMRRGSVYDIVKLVHNMAWVAVVSALGITYYIQRRTCNLSRQMSLKRPQE